MVRLCQWIQIFITCLFIIITLGFISVEIEWTD